MFKQPENNTGIIKGSTNWQKQMQQQAETIRQEEKKGPISFQDIQGKIQKDKEEDEQYMLNLRTRFPMRDWLNTVQCKLSIAQLATLCPSFGRKMADQLENLTLRTPKDAKINAVSIAWHLPVQIEGQTLAALVDTGSSLTLMGEACAKRLGLKATECRPLTMKMANDTRTITTQYIPNQTVTVGDMVIPARFVIMPNVSYDVLLGKDFLSATEANIQLRQSDAEATLNWNGQIQTFNRRNRT
jgi:hypothetical protein